MLPKMPTAGTAKLAGIYKTVRDICNYLPTLVVKGDNKNIAVDHTPYGQMLRVKSSPKGGEYISISGGSPSPAAETRHALYYNNVCRLSKDGTVASFCMQYDNISGAQLYIGNYQYNLNGTLGVIPSSMTPIETIISGTPQMNYIRTWEIGMQFDLSVIEVPSSSVWTAVKAPYYFEWNTSIISKELNLSNPTPPTSGNLSSHFLPIAILSLKSSSESGYYDAALENVNQYPTFMSAVTQEAIQMMNSYTPPQP